jgi:hypothetical protein
MVITGGGFSERPEYRAPRRPWWQQWYARPLADAFDFFCQYRPKHTQAFVASALCVLVSVGISVRKYFETGVFPLSDNAMYLLILAVLFFVMGVDLRQRQER